MGYESKIVIMDRHEYKKPNGDKWIFALEISTFDLSKMGYEKANGHTFHDIFKTPIDFDLYIQNEDANNVYPAEYWREDCYGEHCKYTTIENVIAWLEQSKTAKTYRRAKLLLNCLYSFRDIQNEFTQLCVVHYGY